MALDRQLHPVHRALALLLLPHKHQETEFCQRPVNPDHTLKTQGIEGLGAVYYTLIEPDLLGHALRLSERKSGKRGTLLASIGKFTGRSPNDKHVVHPLRRRAH